MCVSSISIFFFYLSITVRRRSESVQVLNLVITFVFLGVAIFDESDVILECESDGVR